MYDLLKSRMLMTVLLAGLIPVFGAIAVIFVQILVTTGVLISDVHFGYGADGLEDMLARMGEAGRGLYGRLLWLDWINPALYALVLAAILARLDAPGWQLGGPLAVGLLDYVENVASLTALAGFPQDVPGWGGAVNPVKHLALVATLVLIWRAKRRS